MIATLQKQATDYVTSLDDNQIKMVISFIKDISLNTEIKPKRNLSDLKGKYNLQIITIIRQ